MRSGKASVLIGSLRCRFRRAAPAGSSRLSSALVSSQMLPFFTPRAKRAGMTLRAPLFHNHLPVKVFHEQLHDINSSAATHHRRSFQAACEERPFSGDHSGRLSLGYSWLVDRKHCFFSASSKLRTSFTQPFQ